MIFTKSTNRQQKYCCKWGLTSLLRLKFAISNSSSGRIKPSKSSYLHLLNKTKQQFRAGHYKIPHLQQYSTVTGNDFSIINKVYSEFFPNNAPARSVPQVMPFPSGGFLISVECIALID